LKCLTATKVKIPESKNVRWFASETGEDAGI
jgi:hypothetical protein